VDEDGFFAGRLDDGRRNTTVDGSGLEEDPYITHFQQSEFYRPPSAEIQIDPIDVFSDASFAFQIGFIYPSTTTYESPEGSLFLLPPGGIPLTSVTRVVKGAYHLVGASATFQSNGTGRRQISIVSSMPDGGVSSFWPTYVVASDTQDGHATQTTKLSCFGFAIGLFSYTDINSIVSNPRIDVFGLNVSQNSGSSLLLSDIKFWIMTI
jgi:hypothetical protein